MTQRLSQELIEAIALCKELRQIATGSMFGSLERVEHKISRIEALLKHILKLITEENT